MVSNQKIIAILRGITTDDAVLHIGCLLEHGINRVEITTNSPGWETSLQQVRQRFGSDVQLGVGTVTTSDQVQRCFAAAVDFILTPNLNPKIIALAKKHELIICAGVFTPGEIFTAVDMGVDVVKIFPACALPRNYPQLIKGPLSQPVSFSAVGGVEVGNAAEFLRYYDSVGLGSALYKPGQRVADTAARCKLLL
ncbi:bifunctional 4-hydroxy-2-oxoglutarate aldolase/2-dehydro-3-deoxy-phosphogluconate aldolase [Mixta mediterraneensis]|uniref:bifunctional 4-hydroxy-2-oxoglutarate aldolase/2-dehydro-3-deoxy-phosphogluconate aldolase n=1 Tax=Mixta mediterraneensis TaxID=2758443 RepID=UPI001874B343|nr:2-dehydro-3-deoxyphosphogluconate aldolase [Mixta mediterraneensis]MBE5254467.1 2-dehydro-3-deoxyphosphogluconate aldolase [Mixta mediterraneensis]